MTDKKEVKKKELTNNEFNDVVFAKIKKAEDEIKALKETLKPVELIENASLAKCNELAKKNQKAINESKRVR